MKKLFLLTVVALVASLFGFDSFAAASSVVSEGTVETFTVNGVTFKMVRVNDSYSIGKTEVTQQLWQAVMGNNPSSFKGENRPVESVTWYECQNFCKKLSQLTGRKFRLPTKSEWEYAARGGAKSRGYKYSGGNDLGLVGWYDRNSNDMSHTVGQKKPNELGIYDMSGNVWEWCSDVSEVERSYRIILGGAWSEMDSDCLIVDGNVTSSPADRDNRFLGFRLAL